MCSLKRRILRTLRSAAKAYREKREVHPSENIGEFVEANGGRVWALREVDKRIHSGWPNEVLRWENGAMRVGRGMRKKSFLEGLIFLFNPLSATEYEIQKLNLWYAS